MKVTLKATYGILAALDLALQNGDAPVQAKAIAKRQAIPARFLEHVLNALKKAGLVGSQRGAQGGYVLSKPPSEVSLAEIVEALDGPITTLPKESYGAHQNAYQRTRGSVLASVWERLKEAELNVLSGVTLEELVERQRKLEQQHALMYHI